MLAFIAIANSENPERGFEQIECRQRFARREMRCSLKLATNEPIMINPLIIKALNTVLNRLEQNFHRLGLPGSLSVGHGPVLVGCCAPVASSNLLMQFPAEDFDAAVKFSQPEWNVGWPSEHRV